ncbi:hypothetical protein DMUE_5752, partial [Dictyocoela muelleri]
NIEKAFKELLLVKYPIQSNFRYQRFLKGLKLENFYSVSNYKYAIDEVLKRMKIHKGYSKLEFKRLSEEFFIDGIPDNILTKFISEGQKNYSQIFERISDTEMFILSRIAPNGTEKLLETQHDKKWCKYHKSITHNDKDCVIQNNMKSNNKNKINNIKDYFNLPYLYIKNNEGDLLKVLIDTGSTSSFINFKFLLKNRWSFENKNKSIITSATGQTKGTQGIFNCIFENTLTKSTFKLNLKVIDDLEENLIIGNDFLTDNSVNMDLGNMSLKIDNNFLKLNCKNTAKYYLLRPLNDVNKDNSDKSKKLSKIFSKYLSKTNDLKPIIDSEFTIPMKNNDTPALTPYPCPQFQEKLMKEEIKNLLSLKIIKRSNSLFAAPCFIKKKRRWNWPAINRL